MRKYRMDSRFRESGFALVIVLTLVALVVIIVTAFLVRSRSDLTASSRYGYAVQADDLARGAVDHVIAGLKAEIVAGSDAAEAGTRTVYLPKTDQNWLVQPSEAIPEGFLPNLVKVSAPTPDFRTANGWKFDVDAAVLASSLATDAGSKSGAPPRGEITGTEWDQPLRLLPSGTADGFPTPYWIYVNRRGAFLMAENVEQKHSRPDPANPDFVVGRYAYALYDVSGLLDLAVAGYPQNARSEAEVQGGLVWTSLDGLTDEKFVTAFRNPASASDYKTYVKEFGLKRGFLDPKPGDNRFVSRQDLVDYAADTGRIAAANLPLFTVHSREVNAPSWLPRKPAESQIDYRGQAEAALKAGNAGRVTNPAVAGVTGSDGEPLLKRRFALSRISLFENNGRGNEAEIKQYFGLTRDPANPYAWVYREGASAILNLGAVASEGREADFFELLQAGILFGSLGATRPIKSTINNPLWDADATRQILQIGANIIDQYDSDDDPTIINMPPASTGEENDVAGIENLPYVESLIEYTTSTDGKTSGSIQRMGGWWAFQVWNPHLASSSPGGGHRFRIVASGQPYFTPVNAPGFPDSRENSVPLINETILTFNEGTAASDGETFRSPKILRQSIANVTPVLPSSVPSSGLNIVGVPVSEIDWAKTASGGYAVNGYRINYVFPLYVYLQKQVADGSWQTTQTIPAFEGGANLNITPAAVQQTTSGVKAYNGRFVRWFYELPDPRTKRFGMWGAKYNDLPNEMTGMETTVLPNLPYKWDTGGSEILAYPMPTSQQANQFYTQSPDGVPRFADSASAPVNPFDSAGANQRHYILNRPFRSVAELGYAFRDAPWKTLDFSSKQSADGALLDLFSLTESSARAGVINLNASPVPVIKALLSSKQLDPSDGSRLAPSQAEAVAAAIVRHLGKRSSPDHVLTNAADLPAVIDQVLDALPAEARSLKRKREAVTRALADSLNTRTWNLLIDVVAESGRFTTNSRSAEDFLVEGKRRYTVHIAMDRITGRIIHQDVKPVYD